MSHDGHSHAASHAGHDHSHGDDAPKPHYKLYFVILALLAVLTIVEIWWAVHFVDARSTLLVGLIAMALAKAGLVGWFYMHLGHETRVMKFMVAIPLSLPFIYMLILGAEAGWRLLRIQAPGMGPA